MLVPQPLGKGLQTMMHTKTVQRSVWLDLFVLMAPLLPAEAGLPVPLSDESVVAPMAALLPPVAEESPVVNAEEATSGWAGLDADWGP